MTQRHRTLIFCIALIDAGAGLGPFLGTMLYPNPNTTMNVLVLVISCILIASAVLLGLLYRDTRPDQPSPDAIPLHTTALDPDITHD